MKKVIIDTNLWISFLLGHQVQFMHRVLTDMRFEVYVCAQLIEEICDVANRKKIRKHLSPNDLNNLLNIINAFCQFAVIKAEISPEAVRDPKDLYLLALADTVEADYIVSGDADLTDIGQFHQAKIIKIADFKQLFR